MTIPFHEEDSSGKLIVIKTYITLMKLYSTTTPEEINACKDWVRNQTTFDIRR
jgi:hypothetical protein